MPARRRIRRRLSLRAKILTGVTTLVVVALVAVGVRFYVYPDTQQPTVSDVVFVIGPPTPSRIALAERIGDAGLASNIMISASEHGDDTIYNLPICSQPRPYKVYCAMPDPFTTQGEAQWLRDMAAEHDWKSVIVITATPHVTRAQILMERCFTGRIEMVADHYPVPITTWVYQFFYQTGAFFKVTAEPQC